MGGICCAKAIPEVYGDEIWSFWGWSMWCFWGGNHCLSIFAIKKSLKLFCYQHFTAFFTLKFAISKELCHLVLTAHTRPLQTHTHTHTQGICAPCHRQMLFPGDSVVKNGRVIAVGSASKQQSLGVLKPGCFKLHGCCNFYADALLPSCALSPSFGPSCALSPSFWALLCPFALFCALAFALICSFCAHSCVSASKRI